MAVAQMDTGQLTEADCRKWLDCYKQAWEFQDPEAVGVIFSPDASYRENRFGIPLRGVDEIRDYWRRTVCEFQHDVKFGHDLWGVRGDQCIATWRCSFEWRPINGMIEIDGMFRLTFSAQRNADGIPLCQVFEEWYENHEL